MHTHPADKIYYGKIMLFGEYAVMLGAAALTIPLPNFRAYWARPEPGKQPDRYALESARLLWAFLAYLDEQAELSGILDLQAFRKDLENGLYFISEIPLAYGAGSSGAVVAAVYERYARKRLTDSKVLKTQLALMENHFHGQSSGIDPLSCYFAKPLLLENGKCQTIDSPLSKLKAPAAAFLLDTKTTAQTAPLVAYFRAQLQHYSFYKQLRDVFLPENENCIQAMIHADHAALFNSLEKLSQFQWEHLRPMIPASFHSLWQEGLKTGDFFLKLCGSGGGGYILGFTTDLDHLKKKKKDVFPDLHLLSM